VADTLQLANRVFLAFKDMTYAWSYLEGHKALEDNYPDKNTLEYVNLNEAALIAVVVTYCRPFKRSRSKDFATAVLNPKHIGLFEGKNDLEQLHSRLLELRDQAIAHADWIHHSTAVLEATENTVLRSSPRPHLLGGLRADELRPLVAHVLDFCRKKAFDLDRGPRERSAL
jgi:hypothetical protein